MLIIRELQINYHELAAKKYLLDGVAISTSLISSVSLLDQGKGILDTKKVKLWFAFAKF